MHEHDLDLIAEYADGASSDAAGMKELLSTCSTCAAEYQTQLDVKGLVRSIEVTPLNELERARIRRNALEAAGLATTRNDGAAKWWERRGLQLASVAAIVFVGVGLVGVLGQLQSQDTAMEAADTAEVAEAPLAGVDRESAFGGSDTEEAAADMADDALASSVPTTVLDLGEVDLDTLKLAIDDALSSDGDDAAGSTPVQEAADGDVAARKECDLPLSTVRLTATIDGRPIEVAVGIGDPDVEAVAVWTDTCEPFDLE